LRKIPFLLLAFSLAAFAEEHPYLVRDLPGAAVHDSMPYGRTFWTTIGVTTWFIANTSGKSIEVFKSDGTTAGTVQVTHGIGVPESQFLGPFLGTVHGKLIYGGIDAGGEGVFALDTNGGEPVLLGRFVLRYLTNGVLRGDALYFSGPTTSEHELWRTDGTPAGTSKIDLMPGNQGAFEPDRDPSLFALGQWIFFYGVTPQGTGLHRTDGTIANTTLLLPLSASALFNDTSDIVPLGDRMLFSLRGTQGNFALWATDGTQAGTSQIATVTAFTPMGIIGGKLLFDGGGLWTTDGTAAGTRVTDVLAGMKASINSGRVLSNRLFFFGEAFEAGNSIRRLYVTEGTAATTRAIMKVDQHGYNVLNEGFVIGNNFYFRNDDGIHGLELWRTDGATAELFTDINPGNRTGVEDVYGEERPAGTVIFVAKEFNTGREPWITDGTVVGTHLLANCAPEDPLNGSSPRQLRASGGQLFFTATLPGGDAIGVSDGTSEATTAAVADFPWTISMPAAAHGHYFFSITPIGSSGQIYASDGVTTTLICEKAASPYAISSGILFDIAGDLWFSDGTPAGTRKIHSFGSGSPSLRILPAGNVAWITKGAALWRTDGTTAGTVEINPTQPPTAEVYELAQSGALVYFLESSAFNHGTRLWRSDGTSAGTTMVKDLGAEFTEFVGGTERMVYLSFNGKLFRSDGTGAGTIELPVSAPCILGGAALGNALAFTSYASNGMLIVWRSDGTPAGTTQLATMQSHDLNSGCRTLTARGSNAYFSGWDAAHGWELWMTDGTPAGTRMLTEIYPGTKSSLPMEMTIAGDRLFFSADSPLIGRELWAIGGSSIARRRAVHH
jgi:ELWxxDGT repeat protein